MGYSVRNCLVMFCCLKKALTLYRSNMIQEKPTDVPRKCISRNDTFPHSIGDFSDVYRCSMVSKSHGKIEVPPPSFIRHRQRNPQQVAIKSLRVLDSSEEAIRALRKVHGDSSLDIHANDVSEDPS